jgi:hypothetical protein
VAVLVCNRSYMVFIFNLSACHPILQIHKIIYSKVTGRRGELYHLYDIWLHTHPKHFRSGSIFTTNDKGPVMGQTCVATDVVLGSAVFNFHSVFLLACEFCWGWSGLALIQPLRSGSTSPGLWPHQTGPGPPKVWPNPNPWGSGPGWPSGQAGQA